MTEDHAAIAPPAAAANVEDTSVPDSAEYDRQARMEYLHKDNMASFLASLLLLVVGSILGATGVTYAILSAVVS